LKTTQNTYLSISGIEVFSGSASSSTTTTTTTRYNIAANTKCSFNMSSVRQSGNYAGGKYPARNALDGNSNTFTVSEKRVGGWWEV
jgi:hypothetical protein